MATVIIDAERSNVPSSLPSHRRCGLLLRTSPWANVMIPSHFIFSSRLSAHRFLTLVYANSLLAMLNARRVQPTYTVEPASGSSGETAEFSTVLDFSGPGLTSTVGSGMPPTYPPPQVRKGSSRYYISHWVAPELNDASIDTHRPRGSGNTSQGLGSLESTLRSNFISDWNIVSVTTIAMLFKC